jgi:hypothetical protein
MVNKAPIWPRPTSTRLNQRAEEFKANLKAVAESLANHDQVDSVSTRHVDQSFSALARVGLTCRKFYRRAEFETACGGILIGAAFASHDCVELCVGRTAADTLRLYRRDRDPNVCHRFFPLDSWQLSQHRRLAAPPLSSTAA